MNTVTVSAGGEGSFCNLFPGVISSPAGLRGKGFFHSLSVWKNQNVSRQRLQSPLWVSSRVKTAAFVVIFASSCPIFKLLPCLVSSKTVLNTGQNYHWEQVCKVACGAANTPCRWVGCVLCLLCVQLTTSHLWWQGGMHWNYVGVFAFHLSSWRAVLLFSNGGRTIAWGPSVVQ